MRRRTVLRLGGVMAAVMTLIVLALPALARDKDFAVFEPDDERLLQTYVDLGDEGWSIGDTVLEHGTVLDPDSGDEIGELITRVQIVEVIEPPSSDEDLGDFLFILDCTVQLDTGAITFYGAARWQDFFADGLEFALTGGTGAYAKARGVVTITTRQQDGLEGALIAFDLNA